MKQRSSRLSIAVLFVVFLGLGSTVCAQDILVLNQGDTLEVKVLEVGPEEVSYKMFDNQEGPLFRQKHKRIKEIVFENGSTWRPDGTAEKPEVIKRFDERRAQNKKLELINDSTTHHIVMVLLGAPELDVNSAYTALRLHGGISYEWLVASKVFGLRLTPLYTYQIGAVSEVPGENIGAVTFSVSPRYYVKNWRSSQFYVGLDFSFGGHIQSPWRTTINDWALGTYEYKWRSFQNGGHAVFGGQVTTRTKFNMNVEVGAGYVFYSYKFTSEMPDQLYYGGSSSGKTIMFNGFVRFGFGARLRSGTKK